MSVSAPELTANAGTYALRWKAENICVLIDRIDDHKQTTSGEVTVRYKPPEASEFEHLHQARLNMTSTTARRTMAGYLTERRGEIDWPAVVEQFCVKTLQKHREGEPVRMIGNEPIDNTARYLSFPLLLQNQPNLIYGSGGSGKSTLAAMLALEVASSNEGTELLLDYEWDHRENNGLYKLLKDGMGLDPSLEIAYRYCSQPLPDELLAIQRIVLETRAKLVIVDSAGAACGGDPQDPAVVIRYFNALRSLRVTTLTLAHVAKENRGPFGSVFWTNSARNIWELIRGTGEVGSLSIGLHHRKVNSGPLLKPIGFKFTYSNDSIIPQKTDARQIPEVLAGMGLADQIEAALLRQAMTPAELADELSKKPGDISPVLSRHKDKFIRLGNGKWGVKSMESNNGVS